MPGPVPGLPRAGLALGSFIAGVALQLQQGGLWPGWAYGAMALLGVLALAALFLRCRRAGATTRKAVAASGLAIAVLFAASAAVFGFGLTGFRAVQFESTALHPVLEGQDIAVTGMVVAMPQRSDDAVRFRLRIDSARLNGQPVTLPQQLLLGW